MQNKYQSNNWGKVGTTTDIKSSPQISDNDAYFIGENSYYDLQGVEV